MKDRNVYSEAAIYIGKLLLGLALSALAWFSLPVAHGETPGPSAAETAQHKARMDDSQDIKEEFRDAAEKDDAGAGRESSAKLASLARDEERYWAKTKLEAAIGLAHEAVSVADRLARTSDHPRSPEAQKAFEALEANCRDCHDQHLEKQRDSNLTTKDERK